MMQQIANFIVDHDPMMVLQRTHDTVRYIRWAWNKDHADPIDEDGLRLFLCDEHHGDLTEEQKVFARRCRDEMRSVYEEIKAQDKERWSQSTPSQPQSPAVRGFPRIPLQGRFGTSYGA